MARKTYKPEEIVGKLRQVDVLTDVLGVFTHQFSILRRSVGRLGLVVPEHPHEAADLTSTEAPEFACPRFRTFQ